MIPSTPQVSPAALNSKPFEKRIERVEIVESSLLLVLGLVLVDLEVSERVSVLGGGDDTEEVLERVLLQVLLCEVLWGQGSA